ncbi:MAG: AraC family transcriptional regulator [Lentisphaeria bacterium]|nr:AraC family transcriptional regulator [Lentisphaeria bacterium]
MEQIRPSFAIAQKCGYSDQLYFSNTFRSHYGKSPREYRKNMLPLQ